MLQKRYLECFKKNANIRQKSSRIHTKLSKMVPRSTPKRSLSASRFKAIDVMHYVVLGLDAESMKDTWGTHVIQDYDLFYGIFNFCGRVTKIFYGFLNYNFAFLISARKLFESSPFSWINFRAFNFGRCMVWSIDRLHFGQCNIRHWDRNSFAAVKWP